MYTTIERRQMPFLKPCDSCGKEISNKASFCPYCGEPTPHERKQREAAEAASQQRYEAFQTEVVLLFRCGRDAEARKRIEAYVTDDKEFADQLYKAFSEIARRR